MWRKEVVKGQSSGVEGKGSEERSDTGGTKGEK